MPFALNRPGMITCQLLSTPGDCLSASASPFASLGLFQMIRVIPAAVTSLLVLVAARSEAQQYTNLLQDRSLSQWSLPDGDAVESGWQFDDDGTLHLVGKGDNIITRNEYHEFDLWFDYRIAEKGNSGIKYRVHTFDSAWLGLEYQIQDDAGFPDMAGKHLTASLYDIFDKSSPIFERKYSPAGDFSTGRIIVQENRIRHWMNGQLLISELDCSPRFAEGVAASKFRDRKGFGCNPSGRLMLTDHGSEVWFRNLFVRRLDGCPLVR